MIKIFIESGVNAAKKHDKETTNEQDFIVKVIAKHFPNCKYKVDFDVIGINGWTNIPKNEYEFKENSDKGFSNLVSLILMKRGMVEVLLNARQKS